jgi:putative DNA primase/helicase
MRRDGPSRSPVPLTAIESARRAAALKENLESAQSPTAAVSSVMLEEVVAVADTADSEFADERLFGQRTALFLSACRRDVALAPEGTKKIIFQEMAKKIGEAVAGQWLPKTVMVDHLSDIADAHGSFGLSPEQIQQLIADAADAIPIPKIAQVLAPPKRRLITQRASDVQPEKLIWVWPGRIPEGKLVLLGGPPGLGKSQLTAFMAAAISNGGSWPCNEGSTTVGSVIFMSAEDGIEDTIVPRLMAGGREFRSRPYRGVGYQAGWHRQEDI